MYTLVIADDEKIEQKVLSKMVQESCPQIKLLPAVSNGMALVECMQRDRPDIVVLDINMPVMNGLDALEIVRLKKNEAKIIVVTAYSRFEFAKRALSLNAEDYILKPVDEETFIQTVNKVCASPTLLSSCMRAKKASSRSARERDTPTFLISTAFFERKWA